MVELIYQKKNSSFYDCFLYKNQILSKEKVIKTSEVKGDLLSVLLFFKEKMQVNEDVPALIDTVGAFYKQFNCHKITVKLN